MKHSIVIPIFNEEATIPHLFERLLPVCKQIGDYEVICVDDGSSDGTFNSLVESKKLDPNIKIIKFQNNSGQSNAFDAGFKNASGDVIITLDADLQNPPEEIPKLLEAIKNHDIAIGWRHDRHDSIAKKFASKFANGFRNFFLKDYSHDTGCSLKAFKKSALTNLKMYNGMHRFFPALLRMEGFSIAEVKVSHNQRNWGTSKYGTFKRAIPAFIDLLAVLWMRKRKLTYRIEKIV